ncbi:MAG TPA: hypothetical protein VFF04_05000 [Candidatus Babeliales bacterium]|nr:hypothetical protein [Candidatus Babeliales bacterium]
MKKILVFLIVIGTHSQIFTARTVSQILMSTPQKPANPDMPTSVAITVKFNDGNHLQLAAPTIATEGNHVGIDSARDTAALIDLDLLPSDKATPLKDALHPATVNGKTYVILTNTNKKFTNVGNTVNENNGQGLVATVTPGSFLWSNYIGTMFYTNEAAANNPIGQSRRIDFCDGECKRTE